MTARDELRRLALLIKARNAIENAIADTIGRPAHPGHIGEFIASRIFDIVLPESAVNKGSDGYFRNGPLAGRSVNIKKNSLHQGLLAVRPDALPDHFLVLAGPKAQPVSTRGTAQPWVIEFVFLFDAHALVQQLNERGIKINEATSVRQELWREAEVYPSPNNPALQLTDAQINMLEMFRDRRQFDNADVEASRSHLVRPLPNPAHPEPVEGRERCRRLASVRASTSSARTGWLPLGYHIPSRIPAKAGIHPRVL